MAVGLEYSLLFKRNDTKKADASNQQGAHGTESSLLQTVPPKTADTCTGTPLRSKQIQPVYSPVGIH